MQLEDTNCFILLGFDIDGFVQDCIKNMHFSLFSVLYILKHN